MADALNRLVGQIVKKFLVDTDYTNLKVCFDHLQQVYPSSEAPTTAAWDGMIGDRLVREELDAALVSGVWDAAWGSRHLGMIWANRRLTVDDVLYVRSRCVTTALTSEDLHLMTLQADGLTDFGSTHAEAVDAAADRILLEIQDQGLNFVEMVTSRYAGRTLTDEDLAEMEDECDYQMSATEIERANPNLSVGNHHAPYAFRRSTVPGWTGVSGAKPAGSGFSLEEKESAVEQSEASNGLSLRADSLTERHAEYFDRFQPRHIRGNWRQTYGKRSGLFFDIDPTPERIELFVRAVARSIFRKAENEVRRSHGVPAIGAGWVSEARLYNLVREAFPDLRIVRHGRPDWLKPQHIDTYVPDYNIGIEYQGRQHDEAAEFFGGEDAFQEQQRRDRRKKMLCEQNGCVLVEVRRGYDPQDLVAEIESLIVTRIEDDG